MYNAYKYFKGYYDQNKGYKSGDEAEKEIEREREIEN